MRDAEVGGQVAKGTAAGGGNSHRLTFGGRKAGRALVLVGGAAGVPNRQAWGRQRHQHDAGGGGASARAKPVASAAASFPVLRSDGGGCPPTPTPRLRSPPERGRPPAPGAAISADRRARSALPRHRRSAPRPARAFVLACSRRTGQRLSGLPASGRSNYMGQLHRQLRSSEDSRHRRPAVSWSRRDRWTASTSGEGGRNRRPAASLSRLPSRHPATNVRTM